MKIKDCYVGQRVTRRSREGTIVKIDDHDFSFPIKIHFDDTNTHLWVNQYALEPLTAQAAAPAEGLVGINPNDLVVWPYGSTAYPEPYCPPRAKHVHTWKEYTGLNERFTYCTECDARTKDGTE